MHQLHSTSEVRAVGDNFSTLPWRRATHVQIADDKDEVEHQITSHHLLCGKLINHGKVTLELGHKAREFMSPLLCSHFWCFSPLHLAWVWIIRAVYPHVGESPLAQARPAWPRVSQPASVERGHSRALLSQWQRAPIKTLRGPSKDP